MSLTPSACDDAHQPTRPTFAALAGRAIDRYAVGDSLGAGGIGEVFLAWDTVLKRKVALKVLHGAGKGPDAKNVARILREGRAAAKIEHVNAVAIYDVGEHDGGAHIVMEYIAGKTLRQFVGDRAIALHVKLRWARDVASALAAAHKKGVIHRDIKPENIMRRDSDGVVKVVDFGIARCVTANGSSAPGMTSIEGGLCGTPAYMAPERTFGEKGDALSDQFTWAVFAYELVTGSLPWPHDGGTLKLLQRIGSEPAEPPSRRRADVPRWVDAVLLRALAKDPRRRFASMDDVVAVLDGTASPPPVLERGPAARPPVADARDAEQLRRSLRRYRLATAALVPAALVAAVGFAVFGHEGGAPDLRQASSNVEAVDAYRAGMKAIHDGAAGEAVRAFERAAMLDPSFAAAHLRAVLATHAASSAARTHILEATEHREALSEHDRDLLRAIEPWVAIPADTREAARRLAALTTGRPDADYAYQLCHLHVIDGDYAAAIDACRAAHDADPTFAGALWLEGVAELLRGDTAEGLRVMRACLRLSPAATSCHNDILQLDANEGRCAAALDGAQHLVDLEPKSEIWRGALAVAAYAMKRPFADVHRAFERSWQLAPVDAMPLVRARAEVDEAVIHGAFDDARRELDVWEQLVARSVDEADHVEAFRVRGWYEREVGEGASLAAHASAFLASRPAWSPAPAGGSSIDAQIALYRSGALSRPDFVKARAAWLRSDHQGDASGRGAGTEHRWVTAYAGAVVTPEDARDALAALPDHLPLPGARVRTPAIDEPIGATFLLAGRVDEALPFLRRAAASCTAALYPFHHTWANLELGAALEAVDARAACDAYRVVLDRWTTAPASRSARRARERWSILGCR